MQCLLGADYLALPRRPSSWLIEPIIPAGGAVMIYGEPKLGKSFGALQLACAVTQGTDWLGFPARVKGPVVYVQLDVSRDMWMTDYLEPLRASGEPIDNIHFIDRDMMEDCFPFNGEDPRHAHALKGALEGINPELVIIDTLRESHSGDENDSTDMRNVIANLVGATQPAALLLVHHSKKPNPEHGPDARNDARGGYHVGRMDTIIQLRKSSMNLVGRAFEDHTIKLNRKDNLFWEPIQDGLEESIRAMLAANPTMPTREAARQLAASTGRSENACRMLIRRLRA